MWFALAVVTLVLIEIWSSRRKERERGNATKRLVEARINTRLLIYGATAGLDAPETARVLALRAAVREGKLLPIVHYSTNEQADGWVDQNLKLMGLADPQKVEELAAPEREALKTAMSNRDKSGEDRAGD
jgi:hypothetical protein